MDRTFFLNGMKIFFEWIILPSFQVQGLTDDVNISSTICQYWWWHHPYYNHLVLMMLTSSFTLCITDDGTIISNRWGCFISHALPLMSTHDRLCLLMSAHECSWALIFTPEGSWVVICLLQKMLTFEMTAL